MAEHIDGIEQLAPAEAAARVEAGAVMVDVREPEERAQARIPGSLFIPLRLVPDRMHELPKDRPLILQCAAGMRSHQAAKFLQAQGFQVSNLMHGIQGWYRMGQTVDTGPE